MFTPELSGNILLKPFCFNILSWCSAWKWGQLGCECAFITSAKEMYVLATRICGHAMLGLKLLNYEVLIAEEHLMSTLITQHKSENVFQHLLDGGVVKALMSNS